MDFMCLIVSPSSRGSSKKSKQAPMNRQFPAEMHRLLLFFERAFLSAPWKKNCPVSPISQNIEISSTFLILSNGGFQGSKMEAENNQEAAAVVLEEGRADGPRWGQMEQEVCGLAVSLG